MRCQIDSYVVTSLSLMSRIINDHVELISEVDEPLLVDAVNMMTSKNTEVHSTALRFVSQCFVTDSSHLVDVALNMNVLDNYNQLLQSTSTELVKEALWGLSNITAGNEHHTVAFFREEVLFERVLNLADHSHT